MSLAAKWNEIYKKKDLKPTASYVLEQYQHLLPSQGTALDLACGQGGNAILLAKAGLTVSAWDISEVAIEQLSSLAQSHSLVVNAQVRDVLKNPPEKNSLDVLVVSFFLDRSICKVLLAALKPNGLVFYQTYCQMKTEQKGPKNKSYLLADNELLTLFEGMKVRVYSDEALLGDHAKGFRNQAFLVAER